MPAIAAMPDGIYYRVKHPEFSEGLAYKALFFTTWAESGWDQITFINERGMTYSVKNFRCFCLNGQAATRKTTIKECYLNSDGRFGHVGEKLYRNLVEETEEVFVGFHGAGLSVPIGQHWIDLPWPKPVGKNPDTESDG